MIVILTILADKSKKPIDLCFMSNSFSDLIMGTIVLPISGVYTLFGHFPFSITTCYIWTCIDFTIGTISMLHITYISYDRFVAVSNPIKYKHSLTSKTNIDPINRSIIMQTPTYVILVLIWLLACFLWIPVIIFFLNNKISINHESVDYLNLITNHSLLNECDLEAKPLVVIPHSIIVYYLPIILIIFFYSKTITILNKKIKLRKRKTNLLNGLSLFNKPRLVETKFITNANSDSSSHRKETTATLHESFSKTSSSSLIAKVTLSDNLTIRKTISISLRAFQNIDDSKSVDFTPISTTTTTTTTTTALTKLSKIKSNSHLDLHKKSGDDSVTFQLRRKSNFDYSDRLDRFCKQMFNGKSMSIASIQTNQSSKKITQEKRITYRVGLIMFTFVLSWVPFSIMWPISSICSKCLPNNLYLFSFWLAYINSFITPLLVLVSNSKYKKTIYSLFKKSN